MSRNYFGLSLAALLVASSAVHAQAADTGFSDPFFKPSFGQEYEPPSPLAFEFGLRYWYAMGKQEFGAMGQSYSGTDTTHVVEGHFRIDDYITNSYLKGAIGWGARTDTKIETATGSENFEGGFLANAVVDFGMSPFQTDSGNFGGFIGYQYSNDSPYAGRNSFVTGINYNTSDRGYSTSGDSSPNNLDIHALRLGVSGKTELSGNMDIAGEIAAIPFAYVSGTAGGFSGGGLGNDTYMASAVNLEGQAYGAAAELMVGFHPTENLTIRVGGRGYFLTGPVNATYNTITANPDKIDIDGVISNTGTGSTSEQAYISQASDFNIMRWGPMFEITGRF